MKQEGHGSDAKAGSAAPAGDSSVTRRRILRFEDLEVWEVARELVRGVYRAAKTQNPGRDPVLLNQMKRAAVSVGANIAEGFERGTRKQQIEFCYIAKGSAGELRAHLIMARDAELLAAEAFDWLLERCERCSRMLSAYLGHLHSTRDRIAGLKFERSRSSTRRSHANGEE